MNTVHLTTDNISESIIEDVKNFCKKCELEPTQPAWDNMVYTDWENKPNTLLYILLKTDRFNSGNGIFSFLYDDDNTIVASSGSYKSDFDPCVIIGGVRTWKLPIYRGQPHIANTIMEEHVLWSMQNGGKVFAVTFNEYNKNIMHMMNRSGPYKSGKKKLFLFGQKSNTFYRDMTILPNKVLIKNTEQYVMYKSLDPNYVPNWPIVS